MSDCLFAVGCAENSRENPDQEVVFFGIGFETTAPANAMALFQASQQEYASFPMCWCRPTIEAIPEFTPVIAYRHFWRPAQYSVMVLAIYQSGPKICHTHCSDWL